MGLERLNVEVLEVLVAAFGEKPLVTVCVGSTFRIQNTQHFVFSALVGPRIMQERAGRAPARAKIHQVTHGHGSSHSAIHGSVALCLFGLFGGGSQNRPSLTSLSYLNTMHDWIATVREAGVSIDTFLYVEMYTRPKKVAPHMQSYQADLDAHRADMKHEVPAHQLADALRLLRPLRLGLHDTPPLCVRDPSRCGCTAAWPRWLEQRLKLQRCVQLVRAHEAISGHVYGWIAMARADMNILRVAPQALALALRIGTAKDVWVARCSGPPYYGQLDWFALARRDAALEWARVVHAPCAWLRCVGTAVNGTFLMRPQGVPVAVMQNERLLAEWAVARGLSITILNGSLLAPPGAATQACKRLLGYGADARAGYVR